jgi:hypothetical protein
MRNLISQDHAAKGATPTITGLRRGRVAGGFVEPVRLALARDPRLVAEIARRILNAHFPESIRQDVMHSRASSLPQLPDCGQCADSQRIVKRDGDVMLGRARCCEPQVKPVWRVVL